MPGVSEHCVSARRAGPPAIGMTTYRQRATSGVWDTVACFLPAVYLDGVTRAGGVVTLLPPQPACDGAAERALAGLDALVLTGGVDIDPAAYGAEAHPATDPPATERDAWEFALLAVAMARRMPVLGICRGAQLLNVARGGSLHQHLPDVLGHQRHRLGEAIFSCSVVSTVPGSRLAGLIGPSAEVRCYHHQAIDRLGRDLSVGATDGEGVIEAVELPGPQFVVAVQWHPEETLEDLRLFAGLVDAAREYADGRADAWRRQS